MIHSFTVPYMIVGWTNNTYLDTFDLHITTSIGRGETNVAKGL